MLGGAAIAGAAMGAGIATATGSIGAGAAHSTRVTAGARGAGAAWHAAVASTMHAETRTRRSYATAGLDQSGTRIDRQVSEPSAFRTSVVATAWTAKPARSSASRVRGKPSAMMTPSPAATALAA